MRVVFKNGATYILKDKTFELKEVKVSPDKAIQRGDTTTYLVSAYMQKQDRSIADVLKKIPGIEALGINKKQAVKFKVLQLPKTAFSPVLISDVALQDNGQGIFLRTE